MITVIMGQAAGLLNPFVILLIFCSIFEMMAGIVYRSLAKRGLTCREFLDYKLSEINCLGFGAAAWVFSLDFGFGAFEGTTGALTELLCLVAIILYTFDGVLRIVIQKYRYDHHLTED